MGIAIPIQATIIPVYYLIVEMGLYDTLWALILPSIAFAIPITVLILTNFLRDVPKELYESMTVDGASDWQMFRSLVLPLAKPAVVTRSEEHTSELQSRGHLVCRLLLE